MPDMDLKKGDIVAGLIPDEHVTILCEMPFGGKTLVEGVGVTSHRQIRRPSGQRRRRMPADECPGGVRMAHRCGGG